MTPTAWIILLVIGLVIEGAIAMNIVQALKDAYAKVKAKYVAEIADLTEKLAAKTAEVAARDAELAELRATMEADADTGFSPSGN